MSRKFHALVLLVAAMATTMAIMATAGAPASARLTPAQQATANAALLALWSDKVQAAKVTSAQVNAALGAGAYVDAADENGNTALMLAAHYSGADCVRLLVYKGANVNARSSIGWTPLMEAAETGDIAAVDLLALKGANVTATTNYGKTMLMAAAESGNAACVAFFLACGADVSAKNDHGYTALIDSAFSGGAECARLLLSRGAAIDASDRYGELALMTGVREWKCRLRKATRLQGCGCKRQG